MVPHLYPKPHSLSLGEDTSHLAEKVKSVALPIIIIRHSPGMFAGTDRLDASTFIVLVVLCLLLHAMLPSGAVRAKVKSEGPAEKLKPKSIRKPSRDSPEAAGI